MSRKHCSHSLRSQAFITFKVPLVRTEFGKKGFRSESGLKYYGPGNVTQWGCTLEFCPLKVLAKGFMD